MVAITLPNGDIKQFDGTTTVMEVAQSIGAGLAYFIYIKAAKRGQKQHSSGTKITAAMESIDCGRSITETKRGVEVS